MITNSRMHTEIANEGKKRSNLILSGYDFSSSIHDSWKIPFICLSWYIENVEVRIRNYN